MRDLYFPVVSGVGTESAQLNLIDKSMSMFQDYIMNHTPHHVITLPFFNIIFPKLYVRLA